MLKGVISIGVAGLCALAFAMEGPQGPGMPGVRRGKQRPPGAGIVIFLKLLEDNPAYQAEVARFKTVQANLDVERQTIMTAIRDEIQNGTKPEEAFNNHYEELVQLGKKRILELVKFQRNLCKIIEENSEDLARKFLDRLEERMREGRRGRRGNRPPHNPEE